jgi:hypothetical protein
VRHEPDRCALPPVSHSSIHPPPYPNWPSVVRATISADPLRDPPGACPRRARKGSKSTPATQPIGRDCT